MSRKTRKRKRYSDAKKAEIVAWYAEGHSAAATAREFGCSVGAVSTWAKAAGVDKGAASREQTAAAREECRRRAAERREQARADLAEATANLAKAAKDKGKADLPPGEMWKLGTMIEVLTKVIRLEEGEPTGREEVSHRYPDIAAMSDDELAAAIVREAEGITGGAAQEG